EVLPVATGSRSPLALILRTNRSGAIRYVGVRGHRHEADLADLHARIERDRQRRDVRQLEGDVAVPAGVDEPGGRMDQQAQAAEARFTLEPPDDVRWQLDPFGGRAENEFARMQDERPLIVFGHLDE